MSEVQKLKQASGPGMAILGSGTLVAQLSDARLIDEYQLVVQPIALGRGRTLFDGLARELRLKRTETRAFQNGCVFIRYEPEA